MKEKLKKYDLITLEVTKGIINNCLVYSNNSGGISIYPIEKYIQDVDYSRALAKIFVPHENIINYTHENKNLLLYAVNSTHPFVREALEYYMKNESRSRKNKKTDL